MLSEVSIIDELKLNCGKRKFVIVNTYVIFVVIYSFMYGLTKFYSKVNGIFYGEPLLFEGFYIYFDKIIENYCNKETRWS